MQFVVLFAVMFASVLCQNTYTSKYDSIDLDTVLTNDRLLKNYVDCLLDRGKCSRDAAELKKHIPEALATSCQKCSEKHKNGIRRVVKHLSENKKDWWNELVVKYDPDGVYRKKYEELSKTEGVQIF